MTVVDSIIRLLLNPIFTRSSPSKSEPTVIESVQLLKAIKIPTKHSDKWDMDKAEVFEVLEKVKEGKFDLIPLEQFETLAQSRTPEKIKAMLEEESKKRKEERERLRAIEKAKQLNSDSVKPESSIDDQMFG